MPVPPHQRKAMPEPPDAQDDGDGGSPEEVQARAWLKAHAHDPAVAGASLPQDHLRDHQTGETLDPAASAWLSAAGGYGTDGESREHRAMMLLLGDVPDGNPLVSNGGRTRDELDKRLRTERAMGQLRQDQQSLLRMVFFEELSNVAVAAELGVDESAVRRKTAVAVQDLLVAIASSWALPVDLADLFPSRPSEGRPPRDREGERLAAEHVVTGYLVRARSRREDES